VVNAAYRNQSNAKHCGPDYRPDPSNRDVCKFDLETNFGSHCTKANDYGFADGKPCILVKINKVSMIMWL